MYDPIAQMEMVRSTIESEGFNDVGEDMTEEKTIELLKEAHDYATKSFKDSYGKYMINKEPMLASVIIGCIAHDYLKKTKSIAETTFKAALTKYKVFENQDVALYMQQK